MTKEQHIRKVYGRRQGRPLRVKRQDAMDILYPQLALSKDELKQDNTLAPHSLFKNFDVKNPMIVEIGFGHGEFLRNNMLKHPKTGFIGAEPFINGVSSFLKNIRDDDHGNIRIFMDDAITLLKSLKDNSLDGIYVLNPDPWPKSRHHKRRMISQSNLSEFARVLKKDAFLIMTTDLDDLAEWMCAQASRHPDFDWTAQSSSDWNTPPQDWYQTRYEKKGEDVGRTQSYLSFRRI